MKVLIIDDDADIRSIARLSLSRVGGMEVIEAASGGEGVRKAREEKPARPVRPLPGRNAVHCFFDAPVDAIVVYSGPHASTATRMTMVI